MLMTRIILESKNNSDVRLIKELAERLNIRYKIQTVPTSETAVNDQEHLKEKAIEGTKKTIGKTPGERIKLPTYQLGAVHGTLSRKELYDYL